MVFAHVESSVCAAMYPRPSELVVCLSVKSSLKPIVQRSSQLFVVRGEIDTF